MKLVFSFFFAVSACFLATISTEDKVRWARVVLLGDSLTQLSFSEQGRWGALIGDGLVRRADVYNRGVGGFTTADYLEYLNESMISQNSTEIAAVTILLGTNDAGHRVPLPDYYNNLLTLVHRLNNEFNVPADKIILLAPPCTDRKKKNVNVEPFAKEATRAAATLNVTTLNLFDLFSSDPRQGDLFVDGVHFSSAGADLVFERLMPLVQAKYNKIIY